MTSDEGRAIQFSTSLAPRLRALGSDGSDEQLRARGARD